MVGEREKGVFYSAGLHLICFLFAFFGLPSFMQKEIPPEPVAISVEILPITGTTNVKPSEEPPTPEEKKQAKPEPEKAKPSPPVKTAEAAPPPAPSETALPDKKIKPEEKKPDDKNDKKKEKAKEQDLEAILKAVKETAQKEDKEKKKETDTAKSTSKSKSDKYDPGLPLSMSEKDAIMSQIAKCWSVPAGAKNAHELVVLVNAEFNQDGSYIKVELSDESKSRYNRDSFFRAAADAAIRAVKMCSPLTNLPVDKYQTWRMLELRFDPKYLLN